MPAIPSTDKRCYTVKDGQGNERRHDRGDRKQDDAGNGAHSEEERPLPWQGIAPVAVLNERGDDRDSMPAENEIDEDYPDQESSCKNCDNNGLVKEEDQRGDAKAETEVDCLTDDLPHYANVKIFRDNNPSARPLAEDCAARAET